MLVLINDELCHLFDKATRKLSNTNPLMGDISRALQSETLMNFRFGGRPTWAGLAGGGKATLQKTGRLRQSITTSHTATTASVGSNLLYAGIHQFGGKTKPHVIRPRRAKALKTPYGIFKKVNHPGSLIPARPFVPIDKGGNLQEDASLTIGEIVEGHLTGAFA